MNWKSALRVGGVVSFVLALIGFASIMAFGVTAEVPIGNVTGIVTMKKTGIALPNAEVVLLPVTHSYDDTEVDRNFTTRTDKYGQFKIRGVPAGNYMVDAYGKAHHNEARIYVRVAEGKTETVDVPTDRTSNGLTLYANQRVFLPDEKPNVTVSGYTEVPALEFQLYSVSLEQLMLKKDPSTLVNALAGDRTSWNPEKTPGVTTVRNDKYALTLKDVEGHFAQTIDVQQLPVGQYLLRAKAGSDTSFTWLTVSKIAMITKASGNSILAFVTDLKTGRPVPGAEVSYATPNGKHPVAKTGSDGTAEFDMPAGEDSSQFVLAQAQGSAAYTWFYSNGGSEKEAVLWAQTDRPLYRPGDTVKYKIVARNPMETGYSVPSGNVTVDVFDADQNQVLTKTAQLSPDGTVWGEFPTDADALPGSYELRMSLGDSSDSLYVPIMTYRKPEYRVDVKPLQSSLIRGDRAQFKIHVETYTGEPAPGMKVEGFVYGLEDWSYGAFDDDYDYDSDYSSDYLGDYLDELKGVTDENGDCTVTYDTTPRPDEARSYVDEKLTLSAKVLDESGRETEGTGSIKVYRGQVNLKVDCDRYVTDVGSPAVFQISATETTSGRPSSGLTVHIEQGHDRWNGRKSTFIVDKREDIVLDSSGMAKFTASPDVAGVIQVNAVARDSRGNEIWSQSSVWASEEHAQFEGPTPDLKVVLDKRSYTPGENAKVLVLTSHPGGSALLTVEGEGVLKKQVIQLNEQSQSFTVNDLADLAPNASVSVSYVFEKEYFVSQRQIRVDLSEKKLDVTVTPSSKTTNPGGTIDYLVQAKLPDGSPAQTDLALGIVDESLYAIQEDTNDPLQTFYPKRWSNVQTTYSFPTIYLDGEDKTPKSVRIRRNFQDTAGWFPNVHTDASGTAKVTLKLPDNVTEWRATVTAISRDTKIGKATSQVVSKKDLMVRLGVPAFFVEGDRQEVTARVSNTTDRDLKLKVSFVGTGVAAKGPAAQDIVVKAGENRLLAWDVTAQTVGDAKFKVAAWEPTGSLNDGVEQTVPVVLHGLTKHMSVVGDTTESKTLPLEVDPNSVSHELTVTLSPTLIGGLIESLPGLVDYPYGCTEQTMSRFLPAVMVLDLMHKNGLSDPSLESKVPDVVSKSLKRLRGLQTAAGGWGWWEYDVPDAQMTAYVLEGFWRMKSLGIEPPSKMLEPALQWSEKALHDAPRAFDKEFPERLSAWIQLASAVKLHKDSADAAKFLAELGDLKNVTTPALSLLVVSSKAKNQYGELAQRAYKELLARVEETPSTAHWSEVYGYESTGAAWEAISVVDPASPLNLKIARYLFASRKFGQTWDSTRDTARILVSASTFLQRTAELGANVTVKVTVNGAVLGQSQLTSKTVARLTGSNLLRPGQQNSAELGLLGTGRVYYSFDSVQSVRQQTFTEKTATDFQLERAFYNLTTTRVADGTLRRMPGRNPVHQARSGEVLVCRVTITPLKRVSQFICEIPIPSNMRIVDEAEPLDGLTWNWWWSKSVFTERKAVFFGNVDPGKPQDVEFAVRAEAPGQCEALPGFMYRMYQPDQMASTAGYSMSVQRS